MCVCVCVCVCVKKERETESTKEKAVYKFLFLIDFHRKVTTCWIFQFTAELLWTSMENYFPGVCFHGPVLHAEKLFFKVLGPLPPIHLWSEQLAFSWEAVLIFSWTWHVYSSPRSLALTLIFSAMECFSIYFSQVHKRYAIKTIIFYLVD